MEELSGLHLKSTMADGAISKIVESKTGLINTEQALSIIAKESGGAEKVAMIKQALGDTLPKKMDYNEFRKLVQQQLIPLEKQVLNERSNYGVGSLGYPAPKRKSFESALNNIDSEISIAQEEIKLGAPIKIEKSGFGENDKIYVVKQKYGNKQFYTEEEALKAQKDYMESLYKNLEELYSSKLKNLQERDQLPLENQTLILSNKSEFGVGSDAHSNPMETLGHIHFLRDVDNPEILTMTQLQSDAFQGTHRSMAANKTHLEKEIGQMENNAIHLQETIDNAVLDSSGDYYIFEDGTGAYKKNFDDSVHEQYDRINMKKAELKNFDQKSLLDKNHQERFLQEFVNYAGERGDVSKIRLPTSETASKIQGYSKSYSHILQGADIANDIIMEMEKLQSEGKSSEEALDTILKKLNSKEKPTSEDIKQFNDCLLYTSDAADE